MSSDRKLLLVSLVAGVFFFSLTGRVWPLLNANFNVPPEILIEKASVVLQQNGFSTAGYEASTRLVVDEKLLDYLESAFDRSRVRDMPVTHYEISFKKSGIAEHYKVWMIGDTLTGWHVHLEDDAPAPSGGSSPAPGTGREKSIEVINREKRTDRIFTYEKVISEEPRLTEEFRIAMSDSKMVGMKSSLVVPPAGARANRVRNGAQDTLASIGFTFVSIGILIAFYILLSSRASLRLKHAALFAGAITACLVGANLLNTSYFFSQWDPLIPKAMSYLETFFLRFAGELQVAAGLLICIAAGDAIDQSNGDASLRGSKGRTLWLLARGKILDPDVAAASGRGFLIGLLCGGTLAGSVLILEILFGAKVAFQPRGFFLYALNSTAPSFTLILFFLFIACIEELGYRYFGTGWLFSKTKNSFIAIIVPALIYGIAHTAFDFLPPEEPFWGKAVVMTLVGAVWGWAFLRYDALTVVLSHYTADLFIFSWPRLASGEPRLVLSTILVMAVPLLPALLRAVTVTRGRCSRA